MRFVRLPTRAARAASCLLTRCRLASTLLVAAEGRLLVASLTRPYSDARAQVGVDEAALHGRRQLPVVGTHNDHHSTSGRFVRFLSAKLATVHWSSELQVGVLVSRVGGPAAGAAGGQAGVKGAAAPLHQLVCPTFALVYHLRRVGVNLACCGRLASMAVLGRVRWTRPALPVRVALGHFFMFVLNAAVVNAW